MDLDESADMVNLTHLFYCDDWRHSEHLGGRTGDEIFGVVDKVLHTNGLLWSNYITTGSDDVKTLSGREKG
jgi:hypothetical protein